MLVKVKVVLSRFVTVTVLAALVFPTASVPKFRLVEDRLTGALPVPFKVTVWVPALSLMVRAPEAEPTTAGVNVIWMLQLALGAMLAVQVLV
jgi:hypothetical protein